jgi:menaquinone-9 beta-reductase
LEQIVIIGGGLSGLISSILLNRAGFKTMVIEKKEYPFHKVCGEYVSNEVKPFLEKNGLFPGTASPSSINKFLFSSIDGSSINLDLDLGGFGISRYEFDNFLYNQATLEGVKFLLKRQVADVKFADNHFNLTLDNGESINAQITIGSYGKRSKLDKSLNRDFINRRSPYIGVKYHAKTDFDKHTVAIHNFPGGYCGIVKIEADLYNICYLSDRKNLSNYKSIPEMEEKILLQNPFLKEVWKNSTFINDKPEVINEISFETKSPVEEHLFMAGDAAGMITPLCGNGMAIAIHSAKILADTITSSFSPDNFNPSKRSEIEKLYAHLWNRQFSNRLFIGRNIQKLYGNKLTTKFLINMCSILPSLSSKLISRTHGQPF